jgi:hypothetical protein
VLVAHYGTQLAFSAAPRLTAQFASANRFQFGGSDALSDGVRPMTVTDVEPQSAEFFFDLQDFERLPSCFLGLLNERLQVLTEPPDNIKPAVTVDKTVHHASLSEVTVDFEP